METMGQAHSQKNLLKLQTTHSFEFDSCYFGIWLNTVRNCFETMKKIKLYKILKSHNSPKIQIIEIIFQESLNNLSSFEIFVHIVYNFGE